MKKLKDEIYELLICSALTTREIRSRVSGTRGDIVDAILALKAEKLIENINGDIIPRLWSAVDPGEPAKK